MLIMGSVVSLTNTSLALLLITVLFVEPSAALLFAVPVIAVFVAYRAYVSEREQHEGLEMLYESTRILQRSPQIDRALVSLLDHARKMFQTLASHTAVALENGQLEQSLSSLSRLKEELQHKAYHDALTGLANRAFFAQSVAQRLEATEPSGLVPVVLFLDLDDFKIVNDTLGHAAGDELLASVGDRIQATLRTGDLAARIGGDEFAVLLWDTPEMPVARRVANRLIGAFGSVAAEDGAAANAAVSIGVAAGHPGFGSADELLRNADVAMYSAKARGKNRV